MVFYFLIMIQYDHLLSAIACGFAVINMFALQFLSQTRIDANLRLAQEHGKVSGVTIGGLQTIETVKASGMGKSALMVCPEHKLIPMFWLTLWQW